MAKIRDSGMPDEATWLGFFSAPAILQALELEETKGIVVDLGCGYGSFSLAMASYTSVTVYGLDIESRLLQLSTARAWTQQLENVHFILRDFVEDGTGFLDESVDLVLMFNILHAEDPLALLQEAYRILRTGGRVAIIHWNYDSLTPRGPPLSIRPRPEQALAWTAAAGFSVPELVQAVALYHYGFTAQKE